jgi:pimeloyl-ACP methyl ester carboxylesterase
MALAKTDDGVAIEYEVYGSGSLTLLFLHGWGNAASFWQDFLTNHLDLRGLRCVTASFRGHGGSDKPLEGYNHDQFARDMFAVADAISAAKVVIVAFSMATKFSLYMSALRPERVSGQVLLAPVGPREYAAPREVLSSWVDTAPHPERMRELLAPFIKRPFRRELMDLYCENVTKASRPALEGTNEMWAYTSVEDYVRSVRAPTLVVGGEGDALLPPDYVRNEVAALISGSRSVTLPCGHDIPLEMPNETAWLIQAFLAGLQGEAEGMTAD